LYIQGKKKGGEGGGRGGFNISISCLFCSPGMWKRNPSSHFLFALRASFFFFSRMILQDKKKRGRGERNSNLPEDWHHCCGIMCCFTGLEARGRGKMPPCKRLLPPLDISSCQ